MKALGSWVAAVVFVLLVVVTACQRSAAPQTYPDPKRASDNPAVLVLSPEADATRDVIGSLREELDGEFDVYVRTVEPRETQVKDLKEAIDTIRPRIVVLIDNPTVGLYRAWAQSAPKPLPAAVILMASFAVELQKAVPNSVAIPHEVPWVNAFATARAIFGQSLEKVGVVLRGRFDDYVKREAELVKVEGFELLSDVVPDEPTPADVTSALETLERQGAQAIFVLNDNALLAPALTQQCWMPFSRKFIGPILVGVPPLVRAQESFGTFAVTPDLESLGMQAADLIFELRSQAYEVTDEVQFPLSAQVVVNGERGRRVGLQESQLDYVDVLVE
jgi:putative ABC transport system substrate-binding protein